jgi:hypothetical protein
MQKIGLFPDYRLYGQPAGGRNVFWDKKGVLIAAMDSESAGLLLVEKNKDHWTGQIIKD